MKLSEEEKQEIREQTQNIRAMRRSFRTDCTIVSQIRQQKKSAHGSLCIQMRKNKVKVLLNIVMQVIHEYDSKL